MTLATAAWGFDSLDFNGADMRQFVAAIFADGANIAAGITRGFKVAQQGTPDGTVQVAAGNAVVKADGAGLGGAYTFWNDAALASPAFTPTSTNGRKDRLILRVTAGVPALEIIEGVASGTPAEPSITGNNYLELALITLPGSTSAITNAMIADRRVFTGKWAQPWGTLAPASGTESSSTSSSTSTGTYVDELSATYAFVKGRKYRVTVSAHSLATVLGDITAVAVRDGGGTVLRRKDYVCASANNAAGFEFTYEESAASTATVTRKLSVARAAGSGNHSIFADSTGTRTATLKVEDIGPAGNPD
jgi:hypothetical protein